MCCLVNNYINSLSFGIEIFVLGDINFDLLKSCHEGDTLKDLRHTLDLTQHVTSPTRVMPQSSSLIDFILATNTSFVKETRVVECHGQEDGIAYGTWGLSKSFDSIDHATFLAKLSLLGVSSSALAWFKSYMHDHQQYVQTGSWMSGMWKSTHRVPQGSILGQALFDVYINNLPGVSDYCSLESYRLLQIASIISSQGHRQGNSINNQRPEESCLVVLSK